MMHPAARHVQMRGRRRGDVWIRGGIEGVVPCALTLILLGLALAGPCAAEDPPQPPRPDQPLRAFRAEYLAELDRSHQRLLALAQEVPDDRYRWRCNDNAPTLVELLGRLAASSYQALQGLERESTVKTHEILKIQDKDRLIAVLRQADAAIRLAVLETPDQDLDLPIDYLGRRWTVRSILLLLHGQLQEGLGQAATTAICAGVDPPWVRERRAGSSNED